MSDEQVDNEDEVDDENISDPVDPYEEDVE
jgi:hypothetical protein